jgi:AraC-like DNA-binding protein
MIEFCFDSSLRVQRFDRQDVIAPPRCVVIGLQTFRRVQLSMTGHYESFSILFQPAGIWQLFGAPMVELANTEDDACAVIGNRLSGLGQVLQDSHSLESRATIADRYLASRLDGAATTGMAGAILELMRLNGNVSVDTLASQAGLGLRQFERRYKLMTGLRPKLHARIARFEAALDAKARLPDATWTELAQRCGYHDQMHLVHDFREFSSETPTHALTQLERAHRMHLDAIRQGLVRGRSDPPMIL